MAAIRRKLRKNQVPDSGSSARKGMEVQVLFRANPNFFFHKDLRTTP